MEDMILNMLKHNNEAFISGQSISNELGISRAAVWKYINKLKEKGYVIDSVSKNGYKLIASPDILTIHEIKEYLNTRYIGRNVVYFDTIDSTNIKAKELAAQGVEDGTVIISEEQTAGRGRFNRKWSSPKGKGIWMSIILRPNIDPINAAVVTLIGAAAVNEALKYFQVNSSIKWPNDILLNNKKLCGILTEMSSELNQINYLIIGIGVNVNICKEEFSEELKAIATSIKAETGRNVCRQSLLAAILNRFESLYEDFIKENNLNKTIEICRKSSMLIGKEIQLYNRGVLIKGKAIDIDENGLLVIENEEGHLQKVISGEVSMHGLYN